MTGRSRAQVTRLIGHERLSGPATQKILEREYEIYQHVAYERLATISAAHIYNLRKRRRYRECA